MTERARVVGAFILAGTALTGALVAESAGPQTPPAGQTPVQQPPQTPPGRGADPPQGGAGAGQGRGGRRGGFTQFTRELAPQDVIVRGKGLYEANCASCHATDLRGGPNGANLLRSGIALSDQHGELVGASVATHNPAITLVMADTVAIAEYLHRPSTSTASTRRWAARAALRDEIRRESS
jgi:mono/diheme cytochrome c family protein